MNIDFWIAVAALLCSVWALLLVLNHDRQGKKIIRANIIRANVEYLSGIYVRLDNAERAIQILEKRMALLGDLESDPSWSVPVLRTTSGDRPEVKNVEGKP